MPIVFVLFFVSGFAALIYELLWFRQLGFIFGNTVYAATTVVSAYMTGLALGAFLFGRLAHRARNAVRLFGALEFSIGLYALLVPMLFLLLRLLYRWTLHHVTDSLYVLTPFRFVFSFLFLLLPTTLMGGTLPVLSEAMLRRHADFGRRLGWLYGINTLGAVAGVLSAGFALIPTFGLRGTNAIAVAANLVIGSVAMAIGRPRAAREGEDEQPPAPEPADPRPGVVLFAAGLAGFIALGFEVLWFRALTLVYGSTTYSFCAMLGVFLFGIAAGSVLLGRLADWTKRHLLLLAAAEIGVGLYTHWSMRIFDAQPEFLLGQLLQHGFSWATMMRAEFLITLKFLLVPTMLMGVAFTAAGKAVRRAYASPARAVAGIYTYNTAGCVAGTLVGGFVLLPRIGLEHALIVMMVVALAVGLALAAADRGRVPARAALGALALAAIVLAVTRPATWNHKLLAAGPYFSPWNFVTDGRVTLNNRLRSERLIYYKEGVTATASVTKTEDERLYFSMDGKVEADTSPRGMVVQRMIGHLPMLFHPNPRVVMNLGLGAGVTFGALSTYPVDWLEVVEIEPATRQVARLWGPLNHYVMQNPKARVTINDGRNHFFSRPRLYDVITSDPFEPVVGGAANLFTIEHFRQARACLKDDGIMSQWVPMYEMSERDFLIILRSFVHEFPRSALFFTGLDVVMLGFNSDVNLDPEVLRRKFDIPEVRDSLAGIGFTKPEMILGMFVADMGKSGGFVGPGPLNTDNRPIIEFSTPKSAIFYTTERNQRVLLDNFTEVPQAFVDAFAADAGDEVKRQHEGLRLALESNLQRAQGDPAAALATLERAYALVPDNPVIRNELSANLMANAENLMKAGNREEAGYAYQYALRVDPDCFWAYYQLVNLGMVAGQREFAARTMDEALERYPESGIMRALSGKCKASTGDWTGALADMKLATALNPESPQVWSDYARVADMLGDTELFEHAQAEAERLAGKP